MAEEGSVNGIKPSDPRAGTYLAIWFFFQIAADHVFLPILVATFLLAKRVKRNPILINMCITWIIAGISSTLLLYAGKETGPEPSHALCVFQASMLEGTPPMCSVSALALIYTIWKSMTYISNDRQSGTMKYGIYAIIIAPYATLFGFALATSLVAIQDLSKVDRARRFFYCSVGNNHLSNTMGLFTAIVCLICVLFEILIAIRISRAWRAFKDYKPGITGRGFDKHLVIRLFIFQGYLLVALVLSVASIPSLTSVAPDLFAASIGMAVFLVFGTQSDVLRTWVFWLPARPPPVPPKDTITPFTNHASPVSRAICNDHQADAPTPPGYMTPQSRASLMSRKGDTVIIISKPEEAFGSTRC
ncbi:hypothetical protein A7U60_g7399 [Sanghuangporus baumii]|uniref:Uncharacterized protein n=1 Tax=Sanghuangporus baumii TaxID=108892 RepID=A0A9Q5HTW9_SANBA|nr:hypothetical protein A7U60_g7399 [Sanghuangporus baumii]